MAEQTTTTEQPAEAGIEQPATTGEATPETTTNEGEAQATSDELGEAAEAGVTPSLDSESEEGSQDGEEAEPADQAEGAPETYEPFELPEGADVGDGVVTTFSEAAKAANLSQAQAQEMLNQLAPSIITAGRDRITNLTEQWGKMTRSDKEIGGAKLEQSLTDARTAYTKLATPELRQLMASTGLRNHPEFLRLFARVGRALSDDNFVGEGGDSAGPSDTPVYGRTSEVAARLYPTSVKK